MMADDEVADVEEVDDDYVEPSADQQLARRVQTDNEYNVVRKPRNRAYAGVGWVVFCFLAAAAVLGIAGWDGPGVFQGSLRWPIGLAIFGLAVGVLYLLFTFRNAMRSLRIQSVALSRIENRQRMTMMRPPRPAPMATPAPVIPRPSRSVSVLQGVGPTFTARLNAIGIHTLDDLRKADEKNVEDALEAPVPVAAHLKAMADLMILDGMDAQAAELLSRAGCTSIQDLALREPASLARELRRLNHAGDIRIYPDAIHERDVERWVEAARKGQRRDLLIQTRAYAAQGAQAGGSGQAVQTTAEQPSQ